MKIKRTLLTLMAMVLVCAISITGTLAYLTKTTGTVTNTFTTAGLISPTGTFTLDESKYDPKTGELTTEKTTENDYNVIPGATLPKDPTIHITGKTDTDAYLYVKVVLPAANTVTFEMASGWTNITDEVINAGGVESAAELWVYNTTIDETTVGEGLDIPVFKNDQVFVDADISDEADTSIAITAYMCQADIANVESGYGDKANAYLTAFGFLNQ